MNNTYTVLLIEDNPGDAQLVRQVLAENVKFHATLVQVERLAEGLTQLANAAIDIVLLDLGLPDGDGLETFLRVHRAAPHVPVIILAGLANDDVAIKAVQEGAQDYLHKGDIACGVLERAIRYAIERQRLLIALEQSRQREQSAREMQAMEWLSAAPSTVITARAFGVKSLRESAPEIFSELVAQYEQLLDLMLEQRIFKVEHPINQAIAMLADRLGFLNAGPRDVAEIHVAALKNKNRQVTFQKMQRYLEEGRLTVLELMGNLVTFYRQRAGFSTKSGKPEGERP